MTYAERIEAAKALIGPKGYLAASPPSGALLPT